MQKSSFALLTPAAVLSCRPSTGRRRASDSPVDLRTGTKQAEGFDAASNEFSGVTVVGIRNDKGVKDGFADKYVQQFYVDVDDESADGTEKDAEVLNDSAAAGPFATAVDALASARAAVLRAARQPPSFTSRPS